MQDRFVMSQTSFSVKVITKDGIRILREAKKPQGYWFEIIFYCNIMLILIYIYNEPILDDKPEEKL